MTQTGSLLTPILSPIQFITISGFEIPAINIGDIGLSSDFTLKRTIGCLDHPQCVPKKDKKLTRYLLQLCNFFRFLKFVYCPCIFIDTKFITSRIILFAYTGIQMFKVNIPINHSNHRYILTEQYGHPHIIFLYPNNTTKGND